MASNWEVRHVSSWCIDRWLDLKKKNDTKRCLGRWRIPLEVKSKHWARAVFLPAWSIYE